MICLHCGYCCIKFDVIIVDNPRLGICAGNLIYKPTNEECQHLTFVSGIASCACHDYSWYKHTPCSAFDQIGPSDNVCRLGQAVKEKKLLLRI